MAMESQERRARMFGPGPAAISTLRLVALTAGVLIAVDIGTLVRLAALLAALALLATLALLLAGLLA
jgi:hypothetical protein